MTTDACTLPGGLGCCGWLHSLTRGAWRVAPPISGKVRTDVSGCECWRGCIWIVYTCRISVEVLRPMVSLHGHPGRGSGHCSRPYWAAPIPA